MGKQKFTLRSITEVPTIIIVGGHHDLRRDVEGRSIKKVENHWPRRWAKLLSR